MYIRLIRDATGTKQPAHRRSRIEATMKTILATSKQPAAETEVKPVKGAYLEALVLVERV
jgi:hypothetical protein